jgi:hypothetical protein
VVHRRLLVSAQQWQARFPQGCLPRVPVLDAQVPDVSVLPGGVLRKIHAWMLERTTMQSQDVKHE